MVQNLFALLGEPSHLWRPRFPVDPNPYPIDAPLELRRFSAEAVAGYRYIEKPSTLELPNPFGDAGAGSGRTRHGSIEELYDEIRGLFESLVDHRWIDARNYNRVVNEHFGFNIDLDPVIHGRVHQYVESIIDMIISQGEGVGDVPPPLGSHFMTFQKIIDDMAGVPSDLLDECALPVAPGPYLDSSAAGGTLVEHPYTREVMALFDDGYQLMCRMLTGFFDCYELDTTTGIHPPRLNAWFQTAFYPLMTMMMRPLGEILCRLPVAERPERGPNGLPTSTAGPSFELRPDDPSAVAAWYTLEPWVDGLDGLAVRCRNLATVPTGIEPIGFDGARSLSERLSYMSENLHRMSVNFRRYWNDEMVTVIPSKNFQNLPGIN